MKLKIAGVLLSLAVGMTNGSLAKPTTKAPSVQKEEAPLSIEGTVVGRGDAGFFAITIADRRFVIKFYDAERKLIAPNVAAAALRWDVRYQPTPERAFLKLNADGTALTSEKVIRPPYSFKLFVTLLPSEDAAGGGETYPVDFSG
jgi:hypothetical protein